LAGSAQSQPCSLDLTFAPALDPGSAVYTMVLQTNGQIIIGGAFQFIEQHAIANIARLNSDGTLDATFDPATAADIGYVNSIAIQNDGKIIIGGFFFSSLGANQGYVTILNPNGSIDEDFDPALYLDGPVNVVLLQPDGQILLGGSFNVVDTLTRRSIARLHADGTLDMSFDACVAAAADAGATGLALQPDGKILVGGRFTFSRTTDTRAGVARLGLCGEFDPTYASASAIDANTTVSTMTLLDNGKLLVGGSFYEYDLIPRSGIAQLTPNGFVDAEFDPGTGINGSSSVYGITVQSDGLILIGGSFQTVDERSRIRIGRLDGHGTLDLACDPTGAGPQGLGPNDTVSSFCIQPNGQILVAGKFSSFDNVERNGMARLQGGVRPRLTPPIRGANGHVQLTCLAATEQSYTIQSSSNLTQWAFVTNFNCVNPITPIVDPDGAFYATRFYRAIGSGSR